jgi:hypothetical protein
MAGSLMSRSADSDRELAGRPASDPACPSTSKLPELLSSRERHAIRGHMLVLQWLLMYEELGARSDKARVRAVSEEGRRLYLEYPSGQVATVDWSEPPGWPVAPLYLYGPTRTTSNRCRVRSGRRSRGLASSGCGSTTSPS